MEQNNNESRPKKSWFERNLWMIAIAVKTSSIPITIG